MRVKNTKCDKCGGIDIVRYEKDLIEPPTYRTMTEYVKQAKAKEGVAVTGFGMIMPHPCYLRCMNCGFEIEFTRPEYS